MENTLTPTVDQRIAQLSPAKRALLERYLAEKTAPAAVHPSIPKRETTAPPPLSFAQQRLWFLEQLQPGMVAYNTATAYRLRGQLDRHALQQALTEILRRHESLRTTFAVANGEPYQMIQQPTEFPLPLEDLSHLSSEQWDAAVEKRVVAESRHPFDLTRDLMWRARLLHCSSQEHVLLITSHHIASDGWSNSLFWRELTTLYAAFAQGHLSPLAPLPIQYADYTSWQHQWQQGAEAQRQLAYWREQLADVPPLLELPTDRPRPVIQTYQGASHSFFLPAPLTEALKALGQQENATLFMTLLTGFSLLLHRYTGQDDLIVGAPIAGRHLPELEGMLGFFLNNLVLRARVAEEMTARDLLRQVQATTLNAYTHQQLPFEKILEVVRPERSLSHNSLFQVMFILQNTPPKQMTLADLAIETLAFESGSTKFDLTVSMTEEATGLQGKLRYRTDLFDASTMARLARHYQTLLTELVNKPDCPIGELALSDPAEQAEILVNWNQTAVDFGAPLQVVQRLQTLAARTPHATAFLGGTQQLSFQELNQRANQLAHYLQQIGIQPGMSVGVCLERTCEVPIALLAIFKVGGVYVPLDPRHPPARLAYMIQAAELSTILTQTAWLNRLPDPASSSGVPPIHRLCLDTLTTTLAAQPATDSTITPSLDSPAYILFTSGSTGQPKGVIIPYRYLHNRLNWSWQSYPLAPHEVGCQSTSINFTDSMWELLGYLLQGLPTLILPDTAIRDANLLVSSLAKHRVTRLWLTPSLLRLLLDLYPDLQQRVPALAFWVTTGEPLTYELVQRFQTLLPSATLHNHYGSTEASSTTWWDSSKPGNQLLDALKPVPIGRPTANVRTYILDKQLRPVPLGAIGELHVGGDNLACGYLQQPASTAERFIANPFADDPTARLYKTGDRARFLPDGQIELHGRADFQVKLRGFRIELGEVESALQQHAAVRQSVAKLGENQRSDPTLVAYVVFKIGATATVQVLKAHLQTLLPSYMVPSVIVSLDALPLTPSGKIDRHALSTSTPRQPQMDEGAHHAPDLLESQLCQIWERVLRVEPVSVQDNFFELGGHSLLAIQLLAQIATLTGAQLPIATLFHAPTVSQLAACLRQQSWKPPGQAIIPTQPNGHKPPLFIAPPGGSTILRYVNITRHLPPDQPVYGFHYLGFESDEEPHRSVEAMATYYIEHLRTIQPVGPYFLVGICFGNDVMLEVAQQLQRQGQEVAMLILVDSSGPANGPGWKRMRRFDREYWQLLSLTWRKRGIGRWLKNGLKNRLKRLWNKRQPHPPSLRLVHGRAKLAYHAQPYAGRAHLIQSEEFTHKPYALKRWQAISIGDFDHTVIAESTHLSLLFQADHAQQVAAQMIRLLQEVTKENS